MTYTDLIIVFAGICGWIFFAVSVITNANRRSREEKRIIGHIIVDHNCESGSPDGLYVQWERDPWTLKDNEEITLQTWLVGKKKYRKQSFAKRTGDIMTTRKET